MAPLIEEPDFLSSSSHENPFDKTVAFAPLHEGPITATRGVYFDESVIIYDVEGLDDYTQEEKNATWFNVEDMLRMKNNARQEGKLLESGLLVPGKNNSIRGLEHRTRDGAKQKRQSRVDAYAAVFGEIDFQLHEEIFDEDAIADAYFVHSEDCAVNAHLVAKQDAIEAMNIYMKSKRARVFWKKYLKHGF